MSKNILLVISAWGIGGEQRAASILINEFISRGYSVDVVTFKIFEKSLKLNPKAKIKIIKDSNLSSILKNISRIKYIRSIIKKGNYNLVIGFAIIPSIIVSLANIGLKSKVIVTERSDPKVYNSIYKITRRISYRFADGAVFQTNDAKNYFNWLSNVKKKVIKNPIDLSLIPSRNKDKLNKRIVTMGRLVDVKNHKLLIDSFYNIHNEYYSYELAIYGDGPLKNTIESYINKLGLSDRVKIYNATKNVLAEIKDDELFILSSNYEGFPNSLVEAMAIGLPVISTNCRIGGPRDIINGSNGILVPVGEVAKMSEAIKTCLDSKQLRSKLSLNARKIKAELNSEVIANEWLYFFEELRKDTY